MDTRFLNAAFPFHFSVDPTVRVTSVGRSLSKLSPDFVDGAALSELVEFVTVVEGWKQPSQKSSKPEDGSRPKGTVADAGNFARLFSRQGQQFELRLLEQSMTMIGQWAATPHGLTFLGSPVIKTNYDLSRFGVVASDFPAHARAIERIETTEKLASLLSNQNRAASHEQALGYELTVAADLLIRFSANGKVQESHALDPNYLPLDQGKSMGQNVFEDYPEIAAMLRNAIEQLEQHGRPIKMAFDLKRETKQFFFEGRVAKSFSEHYVLVGRGVTTHRRTEQRLTYIANHDPLTRLANRGCFEHGVKGVLQHSTPCAIFYIDMNEFKAINDRYGHPIGDEVLKAVGSRLTDVCGAGDIAGRLGGDEFGVIARSVTSTLQANDFAERLIAAISKSIELEGLVINPSASVGIVVPEIGSTIEVVYRNGDAAMYKAKSDEIDGDYVMFAQEMLDDYLNNARLKKDFGRALSGGELEVHYQPIKSLMTGDWYGLEALVRWEHPTRGMLSPDEFIELADESGDLFSIGERVLQTACSNARRVTQDGRELMLTVNLAHAQLVDDRLLDMIRGVLDETGWSARRLLLEIPETAIVNDLEKVAAALNALRGLGIRVAVDDFGMGQSSLRYLEELPIDMIKLDRELMAQLDGDDGETRLIESVLRLGHTFGFDVVAEGVERTVQEAIVKSFGCRYAQGYHYSKPVPIEHLAGLEGLDVSVGIPKKPAETKMGRMPSLPSGAGL